MEKALPRLQYPHEDLASFHYAAFPQGISTQLAIARQAARVVTLRAKNYIRHSLGNQSEETKLKLHRVFNGNIGAEQLQRKQRFSELVHQMGYQTPVSMEVNPGTDFGQILGRVEQLDTTRAQRFCKPVGGTQGKGIYIADSPETAVNFVRTADAPYLIQSYLRPEEDIRYILHRDPYQFQIGELPRWRIAYKKVRPSVTGDGQQTIRELVSRSTGIPESAKKKYKHARRGNPVLKKVPKKGEHIELIQSGNISQGAYGKLVEGQELNNLDRFMMQFLRDLEEKIGGKLGTLCFDIGITNPQALLEPYDFESMKESVVFYEFQVPFGFTGYLRSLPNRQGLMRLVPQKMYQRNMEVAVTMSLLGTGIQAQKQK